MPSITLTKEEVGLIEKRVLEAVQGLREITSLLRTILEGFGTKDELDPKIVAAGASEETMGLMVGGTELYGSILRDASSLYRALPKHRQMQAIDHLSTEMSKAGGWPYGSPVIIEFLRELIGGKRASDEPMYMEKLDTAACMLDNIVKISMAPDAIAIRPDNVFTARNQFEKVMNGIYV
jgi:hypothetical protein